MTWPEAFMRSVGYICITIIICVGVIAFFTTFFDKNK